MYRGTQADYICHQIQSAKIGQDVLSNVEYCVNRINDDWYDQSFITLSGQYLASKLPHDVSLLHIIFKLCVEIVEETNQGTLDDISVTQCDQKGKDEIWFKVKYRSKYTFAQCRYYIKTNRLEIHVGY